MNSIETVGIVEALFHSAGVQESDLRLAKSLLAGDTGPVIADAVGQSHGMNFRVN